MDGPEAPSIGTPERIERSCESCSAPVRLLVVRTADGSPDLIRPFFPDGAWLGWMLEPQTHGAEPAVSIIALCSRACAVEWFDRDGAGV